ncbi:hypothetical protein [Rubellimicrobium arenae]|uniref:hypothetical protein n=1 Tax=Rubellimicrobium arenae TaxID=2817372 RepID=UPI001B302761|nr:hypothetical protein [Rubellimicrobium arenae]
MDITTISPVPRVVMDARPSADAAATTRIAVPPLATAQGPVVAPASRSQGGLVVKGLITLAGIQPPGSLDGTSPEFGPQRVLKPWGVRMLPSDEPDAQADRTAGRDAAGVNPETPTSSTAALDGGDAPSPAARSGVA